jgi:two-component system, chemotaxis family, sensor kinase Cph1
MSKNVSADSWKLFSSYDPNTVSFASCEDEPIHLIGSIQSHGHVLIFEVATQNLVGFTKNIDSLGFNIKSNLELDLVPTSIRNVFRQTIKSYQKGETLCQEYKLANSTWLATFRPIGDLHVGVEFEPGLLKERTLSLNLHEILTLQNKQNGTRNITELYNSAVDIFKKLSGFDRVLLYKFHPDWHGEVVAEAKNNQASSFLGLHFPASDIPKQARELYQLTPVRAVANINATPTSIYTCDPKLVVDLASFNLRSLSQLHVQYLRNMGVVSSLSVSLIKEGKLWGLIVAHHTSPYEMSFELRLASELLGRVLSAEISELESINLYEKLKAKEQLLTKLLTNVLETSNLTSLFDPEVSVKNLFSSDVCVLCNQGEFTYCGLDPTILFFSELKKLFSYICSEGKIFASDSGVSSLGNNSFNFLIGKLYPGLLLIPLSLEQEIFIAFLRFERLKTISWGGEVKDKNVVLTPRRSFSEWRQTILGRSEPWSVCRKTSKFLNKNIS